MAAKNYFDVVDRLADGRLAEQLTQWRQQGDSFNTIAVRIHDELDIDVTAETVRRWVRELEALPSPAQNDPDVLEAAGSFRGGEGLPAAARNGS